MRSVDLVWESRAELATSSHHTLRELDKVVLRNAILCQNTGICWWGVVGFHHHLPLSQMLSRRVQPARRARRLQVGGRLPWGNDVGTLVIREGEKLAGTM